MEGVSGFVLGADVSMNHGGFVYLDEAGEMTAYRFVTDRLKTARKSAAHGTHMPTSKIRDMHARGLVRLSFWTTYFTNILEPAEYVGAEDYAYRMPMNAHQIGEVGGQFRLKAWLRRKKIRFHDPSTVKMFAAYDGSADKREVAHFAKQRWPEAKKFERYSHETARGAFTEVEEDLCEALAIAKLVWLEIQLRAGVVKLSDLHTKEIQVFNRTTDRWPVNILGREWYQRSV